MIELHFPPDFVKFWVHFEDDVIGGSDQIFFGNFFMILIQVKFGSHFREEFSIRCHNTKWHTHE